MSDNYRYTIEDNKGKQIANISFSLANDSKDTNDNVARVLMNEFLGLIAAANYLKVDNCNSNLYREEWIEGI